MAADWSRGTQPKRPAGARATVHLKAITARGFRAGVTTDLTCTFPGRFSLLVGANNSGKTTVSEALYLAHRHRFPQQVPRPSAAALRPAASGSRELEVTYVFDADPSSEGPLGNKLLRDGFAAPTWTRTLSRSLGRIRVEGGVDEAADGLRLIYLPAQRNPVDELARREADVVVELLRAQQQQLVGHRSLGRLRHRAEGLLEALVQDELIESLEERIRGIMTQLSGGVVPHFPFVGGQVVDDHFLARVLELLLGGQMDRGLGQRLELSGLGYVNLLHIAVTLAAIPDLQAQPAQPAAALSDDPEPDEGREEIREAAEQAAAEEDSFFRGAFHATVVIEEPEAHLHPQLQHGLVRHLRKVVERRPEIQVVVSSHASDLVAACAPEELVVLRRTPTGRRSFSLADLPDLPGSAMKADATLRMTALHLDVTRSASLFAERLVLVEGISDAMLLRQFARNWAGDDPMKRQFVEALTILPIGSKVGEWPVRLLATPGFELVTRLAVLTDTDRRGDQPPANPVWTDRYPPHVFAYYVNHPTLEPAILTPGSTPLIKTALAELDLEAPDPLTSDALDALFRGPVSTPDGKLPAGPGASKKGEFAYRLASLLKDADNVDVPQQMIDALEFVFTGQEIDEQGGAGDEERPPPLPDLNVRSRAEAAFDVERTSPAEAQMGNAPEPF